MKAQGLGLLIFTKTSSACIWSSYLPSCLVQYGAVMIVDAEEEYYPEEVAKLAKDVKQQGLGLLVFGEWYNLDVQSKMRFFDDNTRSWWTPVTGDDSLNPRSKTHSD